MSVKCAYCGFTMEITGAKPGRYTPTCQRCKKKFVIDVSAASDQPPTVKTLEEGLAEVRKGAHGGQGSADKPAAGREGATKAKPKPFAAETQAPGHARETRPAKPARTHAHNEHGPARAPAEPELSGSLGGYTIEKKLGEGGMGAVYLAKQVSLDRPVAVKAMNPAWAKDSEFIARFTREAYAAAQLTHHNIVQIYDIGMERDVHYFSMEYVPGKTLSQLVGDGGRLDPEAAAGYALQAARGLKFAHDHGMIHRDVKPENLLLNEQGIVKVLDLGLVKTPQVKEKPAAAGRGTAADTGAGSTNINVTMGTPEYMSPEQAHDAGSVDQRADVYSLGCTLYDMVVGKPPFEGNTVMEVLTKHASEPVTPPEVLIKRVPAGLSKIVQRMVAKKREDRYASMEGVIKELEEFLGINSVGPFSPREEHASLLERSVAAFNKSPLAGVRRNLARVGFVGGLILIVLFAWVGWSSLAGAVTGLLVLTAIAYQLVIGVTQKTHVFTRVRQLAFGASIMDWLKFSAFAILAVMMLWLFGLLWIWIGVAVAATGIALALALVLDVLVRKQRKPQVDEVQAMLKSMRLKGLEEDALRQFACKYSGMHWEEFFEALFGYEAKMHARQAWGRGEGGRSRKKFGAWRDSLISWAEARMKKRQERRERELLEKLEEKSLRAKGASSQDAKRKAQESAEWMVGKAMSAREVKRRRGAETAGPSAAVAIRFGADPSEADLEEAKRERDRLGASRSFGGPLGLMILGPHVRLILGMIAIAVCLLWLRQNNSLNPGRLRDWVWNNVQGAYHNVSEPWKEEKIGPTDAPDLKLKAKMTPLRLPLVNSLLGDKQRWQLLNGLSWGIAGMLLVLSSFRRGVKISFLIIPAAVVMIAGEFLGIPRVMGFDGWQVAYAVGAGLAVLAFWLGREVA